MSAPRLAYRRMTRAALPPGLTPVERDDVALTEHHVGADGARNVVLVTLDPFPDAFTVTEIQVHASERRRGYGSDALAFAESVARARGFAAVKLRPKPLDDATDLETLIAWYERAGYAPDAARSMWIKRL